MSLEPAAVLKSLHSLTARCHLADLLGAPQGIAPLPRVFAQLVDLTARPEVDAAQLSKLIETDPALAGELLRVANSPALRPRTPIVALQQAVSWLGIAEVRNIAMAIVLRGEVFVAPGHEPESEELWREAWLSGLWAKELARERGRHAESAFLAGLMHRTGAALALRILSHFEADQRTVMDARTFVDLVMEFEPRFGHALMSRWNLPAEVQDGASDWRSYRQSPHADLAGTVHAAHLLATHTLHPQLMGEELIIEDPVFEHLGVSAADLRAVLEKREHVRSLAGV
jgi:HD-like signal output (HDOD) protein